MRCYRAVLCVIVVLSTVRAAYGVEFGGKSPAEAFTGISGQLVEAAVDGNVQKMEQLIGEGADPNSKDKDGNTALLWVLAAHNTRGA